MRLVASIHPQPRYCIGRHERFAAHLRMRTDAGGEVRDDVQVGAPALLELHHARAVVRFDSPAVARAKQDVAGVVSNEVVGDTAGR